MLSDASSGRSSGASSPMTPDSKSISLVTSPVEGLYSKEPSGPSG